MSTEATAWRTFVMGIAALVALLIAVGLKASDPAIKEIASSAWLIVSAMAARSAVESLAQGSGTKGVVQALTTAAKPGEGGAP